MRAFGLGGFAGRAVGVAVIIVAAVDGMIVAGLDDEVGGGATDS
jgi:hypothetical protein